VSSTIQLSSELTDSVKVHDKDKPSLFCLWYRENSNPHPLTKYFWFTGDLRGAIARGRLHCERLGQRFIHVRPFLTDLDMEEKRIQGAQD
jgi:hypothetical protein